MRFLILALFIGLACSVTLPKDQKPISEKHARKLYEEFKRKYNKGYSNDEHEKRFAIFRDNLNLARYYQSQERGTAEYGVTQFSDLTPEEFAKMYASAPAQVSIPNADLKYNVKNMPKSMDWRQKGAVTPVEDQGPCGSCWAFSAIGNVEGQWFLKTGKLIRLSKQQLLDCDLIDQGCFGGLPMYAFEELKAMGGVQSEDTYPYLAHGAECRLNSSEFVAHVTGALALSKKECEQAAWLAEHGPISVGVNAALLQFYVKGVIFPWPFTCPASGINHGVLTVGYENSFFLPHWIVKNSWGTGWGEEGYFRIFKGLGACGINQMATTATV